MSSNSCERIFATAPIVSALRGRESRRGASWASIASWLATLAISARLQVRKLVLADLDLVAVYKAMRLDPAAIHVRPVERAEIIDVDAVLTAYEECVVARNGHVVEEDARVGGPADRHAVALNLETLPRPASAGA